MQRNRSFLSHFANLIVVVLVVAGLLQLAPAQNADPTQDAAHQDHKAWIRQELSPVRGGLSEQDTSTLTTSSAPVLGPGDEVEITVYGAPDLSEHTRVSAEGNISIPLVGYVRVAGLTSSEAEGAIEAQLRQNNIVNDPQVSLYVKEYTSGSISVAGEVAKPGAYSALGPHRLFDVLQGAGGLTEKAANRAVHLASWWRKANHG